jgi:hypothetical protein
MYSIFLCLSVFYVRVSLISTENFLQQINNLELIFNHQWNRMNDTVTIDFIVSNQTLDDYRYYYFDIRPFASLTHIEYFTRQRLVDTKNSLSLIGLHENDYVTCVSFVDEYENIFKARHACYEFTVGEKMLGSHHAGSSGYLSPLLVAVVIVLHTFIAIVHHIKSQDYPHRLFQRFINVNPRRNERTGTFKHSLKQLDHVRPSACIQRRLSRVSVDGDKLNLQRSSNLIKLDKTIPLFTISELSNPRLSSTIMATIPEYHV